VSLPLLGVLAAIAAFRISAPFEATLNRGLSLTDPRALFTYGTMWGEVNRIAFGALICGPFVFALSLGRRSWPRTVAAGLIATVLGGFVNHCTDSGSDMLGITVSSRVPFLGSVVATVAWCVLVPLGFAFTICLSLGVTQQRVRRAWFATLVAAIGSFIAQNVGALFASTHSFTQTITTSMLNGGPVDLLRPQLPAWQAAEIGVGLVLGFTMAFGDEIVRRGTLRLVLGRNEFRDWSLDYATTRIGSAEGCEVPLFGRQGVEKVHAVVTRQGEVFNFSPFAPCFVNGAPATQVMLRPGDTIQMGDATLIFYGPGRAGVPAPSQTQAAPLLAREFGVPIHVLLDSVGTPVRLGPGRYIVGRDDDVAICLRHDSTVSRRHAEVVVTPAEVQVVELGSTNGTRINGARLTGGAPLRPGDVIEFGSSRFTLQS